MSLQKTYYVIKLLVVATVLLNSFILIFGEEITGPIVNTTLGSIVGSILKSDNGRDFYAYRGIPYAKPPIKNLRFRAPRAIDDHWEGLLDATEEGPQCMQYDFIQNTYLGDEDCLQLSVYKPAEASEDVLPVMFFIHGGGFLSGSGVSYKAHRFMDKDVVLVVINYRLGVLGFLSTEDEYSPGNYGLLDQTMALRWVRDNIANFGGDPNKVTIFGNSAGSASVNLHLISPLSKGLFHAAILQSGTAFNNWADPQQGPKGLKMARDTGALVNCPTDNNREMMECLRKRPALDVLVQSSKLLKMEDKGIFLYAPVIDKLSRGQDAFLPDHPLTLLTERRFSPVPLMAGINKDEGLILFYWYNNMLPRLEKMDLDDLQHFLIAYHGFMFEKGKNRQILQVIYDHYFQNKKLDAKDAAVVFGDIASDFVFTADMLYEDFAKYYGPLYVYKLTYRGTHSVLDHYEGYHPTKVTHVDELQYQFRSSFFVSHELSPKDKQISDIILTLWTNFAKNKIPDLNGSLHYDSSFQWEPTTTTKYQYLDISLPPKLIEGHLSSNYDFWKNILKSLPTKDEL